jgi:hypothetical protein
MIRTSVFVAVALAVIVSACGPSKAPGAKPAVTSGHVDACALLGDAGAIFGKGAVAEPDDGLDDMAGLCRAQSADGKLTGDVIVYDGAKAADHYKEELARWDGFTETPLAPVEGLGDEAQIALDLPGYQTQIAFRKGERVVLIAGRSGDAKITGEDIARKMAKAAAAHE